MSSTDSVEKARVSDLLSLNDWYKNALVAQCAALPPKLPKPLFCAVSHELSAASAAIRRASSIVKAYQGESGQSDAYELRDVRVDFLVRSDDLESILSLMARANIAFQHCTEPRTDGLVQCVCTVPLEEAAACLTIIAAFLQQ